MPFLNKCIQYHPHLIQSNIEIGCINVKLDDINRGSNTEPCSKVILRVSVYELHMYTIKKYAT